MPCSLRLFILVFAISLSFSAQADEVVELIEQANRLAGSRTDPDCDLGKTTGEIPVPKFRPSPQEIAAEKLKAEQAVFSDRATITDFNGRKLPITVISEDQVKALKGKYTSDRIYDPAVCAMRAHLIGAELGEQGIETVKIIVEPEKGLIWDGVIEPDERARFSGRYKPQWKFHVANLIYVRGKDGKLNEYIIDPAMESYPVPRAKWEQRMKGVATASIASRYVADTKDMYREELSYDRKKFRQIRQIMISGRPIDDATFEEDQ